MRPKLKVLLCFIIIFNPIFGYMDSFAQERTVYKCTNAAGVTVYTDKECPGRASQLNLKAPADDDLSQKKAEHDAKVSQDKALADQIQARRLSDEQAARAVQDQQVQVDRAVAAKFEQERAQRNSAVVSNPAVTQIVAPTTSP